MPVADALWAKRAVFRTTIALGESASTPWLSATASSMRIGVDLTLLSHRSAQELRRDGAGEDVSLYRFPLHYRVRDQAGQLLIDQWVMLDATQQRTLRQDHVELNEPVQLDVHANFDRFQVDRDQRVRVEALLLPDQSYGAELLRAELRAYRQATISMAMIQRGLSAALIGIVMMVLGLVGEVLVSGWPMYRPMRQRSRAQHR